MGCGKQPGGKPKTPREPMSTRCLAANHQGDDSTCQDGTCESLVQLPASPQEGLIVCASLPVPAFLKGAFILEGKHLQPCSPCAASAISHLFETQAFSLMAQLLPPLYSSSTEVTAALHRALGASSPLSQGSYKLYFPEPVVPQGGRGPFT